MDQSTRFDTRSEIGRLLAVLGFWGVAVTQPLLGVFGSSPETFVFYRADGADLVWFALAVALVPPVAIWAVGVLIGVTAPSRRPLAHAATIGALAALAVAQVITALPGWLAVTVATAVAMAVTSLVHRHAPVRLWTQLMVALPVISVIVFLTSSDAATVLDEGGFDPIEVEPAADLTEPPPSVIFVVLDEFATTSMIDRDAEIDSARFPHLADFAEDATWYRNATTVSGWTATAVPALVTGQLPDNSPPFWSEHPDNLFRLLQPTHDLVVSESLTRLCPISVCGERPSAPVPAGVEAPTPIRVDADLEGLYGDAVDVMFDRLSGETTPDRFDDFVEEIVSVAPDDEPEPFSDDEDPALRSVVVDTVAEPRRWGEFIDVLVPAERPVLGFIHLEIPHHPWVLLPDGSTHGGFVSVDLVSTFHSDPWIATIARQTHLLQASYADALVGQLLDHLDTVDLYDDAMVIITADHGVTFELGVNARGFTDQTSDDIGWVPLLIKPPGQTTGSIDDANVLLIDLVPTIAEIIGTPMPWEIDGRAIDDIAASARGEVKPYFLMPNIVDGRDEPGNTTLDGGRGPAVLAARAFTPADIGDEPTAGIYAGQPFESLIGTAFEPSGEGRVGSLEVDGVADADERAVLASGAIDAGAGVETVVAVVDGRVVAASPVTAHANGGPGFVLMFPIDDPVLVSEVELAVIDSEGTGHDAGPMGSG